MQNWLLEAFSAFESKNVRTYFLSQLFSFFGNWLQIVAQGWLIGEATHSVFQVGMNGVFLTLPVALMAPFGGMITGRFKIMHTLYAVQILGLIQAVLLGICVLTHHTSPHVINVFALVSGLILGIEAPARNTFLRDCVPSYAFGSVVALNFAIPYFGLAFSGAPLGLFVAKLGLANAFFFNAFTYVVAIIALTTMDPDKAPHDIRSFREFGPSLRYSCGDRHLRLLLLLVAGTLGIAFPARTMLPAVSDMFHKGPDGLGALVTMFGVGGLIGMGLLSSRSKQLATSYHWLICGGCGSCGLALVFFSMTTSLLFGMIWMGVAGMGTVMFISTIQSVLSTVIKSAPMSHIMGLDVMMFWSGTGFANLWGGIVGQWLGIERVICISGVALLIMAAALARKKLM